MRNAMHLVALDSSLAPQTKQSTVVHILVFQLNTQTHPCPVSRPTKCRWDQTLVLLDGGSHSQVKVRELLGQRNVFVALRANASEMLGVKMQEAVLLAVTPS